MAALFNQKPEGGCRFAEKRKRTTAKSMSISHMPNPPSAPSIRHDAFACPETQAETLLHPLPPEREDDHLQTMAVSVALDPVLLNGVRVPVRSDSLPIQLIGSDDRN